MHFFYCVLQDCKINLPLVLWVLIKNLLICFLPLLQNNLEVRVSLLECFGLLNEFLNLSAFGPQYVNLLVVQLQDLRFLVLHFLEFFLLLLEYSFVLLA